MLETYYELFIYIVGDDNIDFYSIFKNLPELQKKELLDYISFIKTKPSKIEFIKYNISEDNLYVFCKTIELIIQKSNLKVK